MNAEFQAFLDARLAEVERSIGSRLDAVVESMRALSGGGAETAAPRAVDGAATMTAKQVAELLGMPLGSTENDVLLQRFRRRCKALGLRPIKGARGWRAVFRVADVLRAQSYGVGELDRKQPLTSKTFS